MQQQLFDFSANNSNLMLNKINHSNKSIMKQQNSNNRKKNVLFEVNVNENNLTNNNPGNKQKGNLI